MRGHIGALAELAVLVSLVAAGPTAAADIFSDDFSSFSSTTTWTVLNRSSPVGTTTWQQGAINSGLTAMGGGSAFAAVGYESAGAGGNATASNWLVSPAMTLENGQSLTFDAIGQDGQGFPDRLQVRLNITNAGSDVGTTAVSVGDFGRLLLDINPTYQSAPNPLAFPTSWTHYALPISGLSGPVQGRFAFRYFVEDTGPDGSRGTEIAIDNVRLTAVPEPGMVAVIIPSILGLLGRFRSSTRPGGSK